MMVSQPQFIAHSLVLQECESKLARVSQRSDGSPSEENAPEPTDLQEPKKQLSVPSDRPSNF